MPESGSSSNTTRLFQEAFVGLRKSIVLSSLQKVPQQKQTQKIDGSSQAYGLTKVVPLYSNISGGTRGHSHQQITASKKASPSNRIYLPQLKQSFVTTTSISTATRTVDVGSFNLGQTSRSHRKLVVKTASQRIEGQNQTKNDHRSLKKQLSDDLKKSIPDQILHEERPIKKDNKEQANSQGTSDSTSSALGLLIKQSSTDYRPNPQTKQGEISSAGSL